MSDSRPIGILDSGIGGLTVAKALNSRLPHEAIRFFGDTAHLPYGEKSSHAVKDYVLGIAQFLVDQDCKMILIACNTASAVASKLLSAKLGSDTPVVDVIDPMVRWVSAHKEWNKVGIIATKRTIQSGAYKRKLLNAKPGLKVSSLATPLLVPMIEEGFFNNTISQTIINAYLSRPGIKDIDALILACTHFPLIRPEVERYYKGKVAVVDSGDVVAGEVERVLAERNALAPPSKDKVEHHFYVSDYTASFSKTTQYFFGETIKLEEFDLWKDK